MPRPVTHVHEHLCHLGDRYVPVIPTLVSNLRNGLSGLKGFSQRNNCRMIEFYQECLDL